MVFFLIFFEPLLLSVFTVIFVLNLSDSESVIGSLGAPLKYLYKIPYVLK